ncbi:phosphoglycerate mutase 1, putative [Eimeria brunetti]|uniref:phosphoglycerate mutase (2,3-diphosphoglycerate-dependent) n=1 Tax=Eimeria brunetti TaxID=51314 RepID=U6LR13_9EIME|nr:phosphoglycerate mutase 1, putative [Eimeria brunetti]
MLGCGESSWNKENRFTGWTDVPLSEHGMKEAREAGDMIREKGLKFDIAYTSVLKRAVETCWTVLMHSNQCYLPIKNTWRLNERHYGALQGLNKAETAAKHGEEQVKIWRRAYAVPPPPLEPEDERNAKFEEKYKNLPPEVLPRTECLKDTVERVLPYYFDEIAPSLLAGKNVLVVAHGNSLRGLVKHLDKMSEEDVLELNIPTAVPLVYELDESLKTLKKYYLLDEEEVKKRIAAVANQGKAKEGEEANQPQGGAAAAAPAAAAPAAATPAAGAATAAAEATTTGKATHSKREKLKSLFKRGD